MTATSRATCIHQAYSDLAGFLVPIFEQQPPGRLWQKRATNEQHQDEQPLKRDRKSELDGSGGMDFERSLQRCLRLLPLPRNERVGMLKGVAMLAIDQPRSEACVLPEPAIQELFSRRSNATRSDSDSSSILKMPAAVASAPDLPRKKK